MDLYLCSRPISILIVKKGQKKKNNANALTKIYGVRLVIHVDTTNVDTLCNCLSYVFNLLLKIA